MTLQAHFITSEKERKLDLEYEQKFAEQRRERKPTSQPVDYPKLDGSSGKAIAWAAVSLGAGIIAAMYLLGKFFPLVAK